MKLSTRKLVGAAAAAAIYTLGLLACEEGSIVGQLDSAPDDLAVADTTQRADGQPKCADGLDQDGDGYGKGCTLGNDCNDQDKYINPGAKEVCDGKDNDCDNMIDEGVKNPCGTCDPGCKKMGDGPFAVDKAQDPNLKDINGVGLDSKGDLVLKKTNKNFNFMWVANTFDTHGDTKSCHYATNKNYKPSSAPFCRGTISKINTATMKEVARYFTVTCKSKKGAKGCVDLHGKAITRDFPHGPSRTAVDYNFDVWVANRAFGGQPSASKIANDITDCVDRNGNSKVDTSRDINGDGKITLDCNGDGKPDDGFTICTGAFKGKRPEFLGDDDECILFTVNFAAPATLTNTNGDIGRSICLGAGATVGASDAWVGTNHHDSKGNNRYFKIDGTSGKLSGPYNLKTGHYAYGCIIDSQRILWTADLNGTLTYLDTANPSNVGQLLKPSGLSTVQFYGITLDSKSNVWLGGYGSYRVYRYRPDRSKGWSSLSNGKWTWTTNPSVLKHTRGIAADNRGKVWVAVNNGYLFRVDQSIGDGHQDLSSSTSYWAVTGNTIIGAGVDFAGNVWGISYSGHVANRLDVDGKGDPKTPVKVKTMKVGYNPYTYSDFTGYGLQNFTRPQGRYLYQIQPCTGKKATWSRVTWKATIPPKTGLSVRVRSGDTGLPMGSWFGPYSNSPALLKKGATIPLAPNPAEILQVEFFLTTNVKNLTPTLHDFNVSFSCAGAPAQ